VPIGLYLLRGSERSGQQQEEGQAPKNGASIGMILRVLRAAVNQVVNLGVDRSARYKEWSRGALDTERLGAWIEYPCNCDPIPRRASRIAGNVESGRVGLGHKAGEVLHCKPAKELCCARTHNSTSESVVALISPDKNSILIPSGS
jgi:hypothetical protein